MLLDTLPLEDIKESIVALSTNEDEMNNLLNYKFQYGKLQSLSLAIFIYWRCKIYIRIFQNL